jgi:hypothetical protein
MGRWSSRKSSRELHGLRKLSDGHQFTAGAGVHEKPEQAGPDELEQM